MADRAFQCPYCGGRGTVEPVSQAIAPPYGHEVIGYFTLSCPTRSGNDEFIVDAHGNTDPPRRAPRPQSAGERPLADLEAAIEQVTWLEHHDQLVTEWFDGERKLVDDLYPDPPKRARPPAEPPVKQALRKLRQVEAPELVKLFVVMFALAGLVLMIYGGWLAATA